MCWEWTKGEGSLGRASSYQLSPSNCAACPALCFKYVKSVFVHRALQHQRTDYRAISSSAAPKFLALHCLLFAICQPHMSTEQKKKCCRWRTNIKVFELVIRLACFNCLKEDR